MRTPGRGSEALAASLLTRSLGACISCLDPLCIASFSYFLYNPAQYFRKASIVKMIDTWDFNFYFSKVTLSFCRPNKPAHCWYEQGIESFPPGPESKKSRPSLPNKRGSSRSLKNNSNYAPDHFVWSTMKEQMVPSFQLITKRTFRITRPTPLSHIVPS
jgi:hypothetical protein